MKKIDSVQIGLDEKNILTCDVKIGKFDVKIDELSIDLW